MARAWASGIIGPNRPFHPHFRALGRRWCKVPRPMATLDMPTLRSICFAALAALKRRGFRSRPASRNPGARRLRLPHRRLARPGPVLPGRPPARAHARYFHPPPLPPAAGRQGVFPAQADIDYTTFKTNVRDPLRAYLSQQNLATTVRCILLTKGLPHRIQNISNTAPLSSTIGDNPAGLTAAINAGRAPWATSRTAPWTASSRFSSNPWTQANQARTPTAAPTA